jgi:hypothetical protein
MADSLIAILDATGATQNLDTRTEATNTNHRQTITVGDPTVNNNVQTVDAAGRAAVNAVDTVVGPTNITTQNLVPAGTATANSAVATGVLNGASTLMVQVTGVYTGALSVQGTVDGTNWVTLANIAFVNLATDIGSATIPSAAVGLWTVNVAGLTQARVTALAAVTGTAAVTLHATLGTGLIGVETDAAGAQKTREIRGATTTYQTQWTIATSPALSQVAADVNRLAVILVVTATATGRVYLRFDNTAPTATNYAWYLDPDERYEVPQAMSGLAISFLGATAAGFVNIDLTTP